MQIYKLKHNVMQLRTERANSKKKKKKKRKPRVIRTKPKRMRSGKMARNEGNLNYLSRNYTKEYANKNDLCINFLYDDAAGREQRQR